MAAKRAGFLSSYMRFFPGPSYLAISHVRDELIPPAERQQKAAIWAEVVEYIRHKESRVREEIQHIAGDEFRSVRYLGTVLWIRIRSDPKLFAGSGYGSGIFNFGSGYDKFQFTLAKIA